MVKNGNWVTDCCCDEFSMRAFCDHILCSPPSPLSFPSPPPPLSSLSPLPSPSLRPSLTLKHVASLPSAIKKSTIPVYNGNYLHYIFSTTPHPLLVANLLRYCLTYHCELDVVREIAKQLKTTEDGISGADISQRMVVHTTIVDGMESFHLHLSFRFHLCYIFSFFLLFFFLYLFLFMYFVMQNIFNYTLCHTHTMLRWMLTRTLGLSLSLSPTYLICFVSLLLTSSFLLLPFHIFL